MKNIYQLLTVLTLIVATSSMAQWSDYSVNTTVEIAGVHVKENGTVLISGGLGLLKKSTDCGVNWTDITISYLDDLGKFFFVDEQTGYVLADDSWWGRTYDGGETWTFASSPAVDDLEGIYFLDSQYGYMVGKEGGIVKTSDGGDSWVALSSGTDARLHGVVFLDTDNGLVCGRNNTLLQTSDGGMTWDAVGIGTSGDLKAIVYNGQNGFIAGEGGVYRFDSSLSSFDFIALDPMIDFEDVYFKDSNLGWICGEQGKVMGTTNEGDAWFEIETEGNAFELSAIHGIAANMAFTVGEFGKVNGVCMPLIINEESDPFNSWSLYQRGQGNMFLDINMDRSRILQVQIFDITGSVHHEQTLSCETGINTMRVESNLSQGLYLVSLVYGEKSSTKKIVIQ